MVVPAVMLVGGVWKLRREPTAGLTEIVAVALLTVEWVESVTVTVYVPAAVYRVHVWKVATPARAVTATTEHVAPVMPIRSANAAPVVTWLP